MNPETKKQLARFAIWGALLSIAVGLLADLYVASEGGLHFHVLMATFLGAAISTWLGIALMALVFLSSRDGTDEEVGRKHR